MVAVPFFPDCKGFGQAIAFSTAQHYRVRGHETSIPLNSPVARALGKLNANQTVTASGHVFHLSAGGHLLVKSDLRQRYRSTPDGLPASVASPRYLAAFDRAEVQWTELQSAVDQIRIRSMMRSHDLIRASELGDYVYCRRSWFLSAQGVHPALKHMEKRNVGIGYHQRHGEQVKSAEKLRSASIYVLLLMLLLALSYWLYVPVNGMPLIILIGAILAGLLWLLAGRRHSSTGLPRGKILSADVGTEFPQSRSLTSERYGLTGKPGYVVRVLEGVVPVEIKSGNCPRSGRPHDSHRYQVAAYCLLVGEALEANVPYGLIRYDERNVRVEYTPTLRAELLNIMEEIRPSRKSNREQHISHNHYGTCRACRYRETCSESLT